VLEIDWSYVKSGTRLSWKSKENFWIIAIHKFCSHNLDAVRSTWIYFDENTTIFMIYWQNHGNSSHSLFECMEIPSGPTWVNLGHAGLLSASRTSAALQSSIAGF
jgi:hypothetical protein